MKFDGFWLEFSRIDEILIERLLIALRWHINLWKEFGTQFFVILLIHSKKLIQISFEFDFGLFRVCLNHLINADQEPNECA
jgi:hypothetical protein